MGFIFLSLLVLPSPWSIPQPLPWVCWESSHYPAARLSGARLERSAKQQTRKTQLVILDNSYHLGEQGDLKRCGNKSLCSCYIFIGGSFAFNPWLLYLRRQCKHTQYPRKRQLSPLCVLLATGLCHFSCLNAHINAVNQFIENLIL